MYKANLEENDQDNFVMFIGENKKATSFRFCLKKKLLILWQNNVWSVQKLLKLMHIVRK